MESFDNSELLQLFVMESMEYLDGIESDLLLIESNGENIDLELVNKVFRAIHSIKGSAGCLGFTRIMELSHTLENILSLVREKNLSPTLHVVTILLEGFDLLSRMIEKAFSSNDIDVSEQVAILESLANESSLKKKPAPFSRKEIGRLDEGPSPEADASEALVRQFMLKVDQDKATPPIESSKHKSASQSSIRVDTSKLDQLLNVVGEVVISQSHVLQLSGQLQGAVADELRSVLARLERNTRSLQGQIMNILMIPIGPVLKQFQRLVRDLSISQNKKINLVIQGEETEIDKTIIENLNDPLKHMIRNSVDHGIESAEARRQAGKSETGTIVLSAFQEGGNIVIELSDDGMGLDRDAILRQAKNKGLVGEEPLTNDQINALIFQPGFSTSSVVTDLSGRGVGMDVVKRNIEALRGRVEITSEKGVGTTFRLRLPLTMAIVEGLLVRIAENHYVIPLAHIEECVELSQV
ncbi:MAG TPA: chemotaxis protein CheA, partial [Chroococcales cyanobacterium]